MNNYNTSMGYEAENSTKTVIGRPFQKGMSGNPGGRPRGLANYVRESTGNGQEMVDLMVQVMRGESINGMRPKIRDQMDAASWLADRGFGRTVTPVEATTRSMNVDIELRKLPTKQLLELLQSGRD